MDNESVIVTIPIHETHFLGVTSGLFQLKKTSEWINDAKRRPIPEMLLSELWHEHEICFLFADTNLGKSILAVQIADSISKGESIPGFKLTAVAQKVLYFDFELSDKQFEIRYKGDYGNHYEFNDNFLRAEFSSDPLLPDGISYDEYLNQSFESAIVDSGAKIIIIDNITFLRSDNEKAKDALPLMKHLKALKKKYALSILVLAHTPKRDNSRPIGKNDLQGSKMLINFCDSAFAIGESQQDKALRYIKQIKCRNTEVIYDATNVLICEIIKSDNFLKFDYIGFDNEQVHLMQPSEEELNELEAEILNLYKEKSLSQRQIAQKLKTNYSRVNRTIKKFMNR